MAYILGRVYPDEVIGLLKRIRLRTVDTYLINARIAANPHMEADDARSFIEELLEDRREITGFERADDTIDHEGVAKLKGLMAKGKAVKIV